MGIESASYLSQLDPANPAGSDPLADADNHLRLIKQVLKNTFPNLDGAVGAKVNDFKSLLPINSIVMWYGEPGSVPDGWTICDGKTVTKSDGSGQMVVPDLRARFVVGSGGKYEHRAQVGSETATGTTSTNGNHNHNAGSAQAGTHSHSGSTSDTTLTLSQIPSHTHTLSFNHIGYGTVPQGGAFLTLQVAGMNSETGPIGGGNAHRHSIGSDGGHSHNIEVFGAGDHQHTVTVGITPLATALYYIIRI